MNSVQTRWQFLLQISRDSSALSLVIPAAFALIIFLTGLGGVNPDPGGLAPMFLDLSAGGAAVVVFAIAKIFRFDKKPKFFNGFVWLCAGIASVYIPVLIDAQLRGHFSTIFLGLAVVGTLAYPSIIMAIGIIWSGWLGTRAIRLELAQKTIELTNRKNSALTELEFLRNQTFTEVKSQVSQMLAQVESAQSSARPDQLTNALLQLVDNVIRPMSQNLIKNRDSSLSSRDLLIATEPSRKAPVSPSQLASPVLFFIFCILFSAQNSYEFFGSTGLLLETFSTMSGTIIQFLWARTHKTANSRSFKRFFLVAFSTWAPSLVFLVPAVRAPELIVLSLTKIFGTLLINLGITGFLFVTARRMNAIEARAEAVSEAKNLVKRLQQQEWFERERLARAIHGQVQSKVLIASLRLSKQSQITAEILNDVKSDLIQAMDALDGTLTSITTNFEQQFQTLVENWRGSCEISLNIENSILERINRDAIAGACAIEILREAISNAVKHCAAKSCEVLIIQKDESQIKIKVSNTGQLLDSSNRVNGYGMQIMDELSSTWQLKQSGAQVELHTTLELR